MESFYIVIVGLLFILAISDLIVGVSNDAVNFLNSAVGSKAASFKVIMLIAALGVVVGATFSSGMMEVARKGIYHPDIFFFSEVMIIFFAVMITDVILLDTFNTFGLPTSTTVSIVFELLGAAVAVSVLKVMNGSGLNVSDYINSSQALTIVSGILLSVVVAFVCGAVVQYLSRLVFSFRFKKQMRLYGSLWGGISITAITYFILIKGLRGSSFADYDMGGGLILKEWIQVNAFYILMVSFGVWTVILQLLSMFLKLNIPRLIVLVGTFALAMAFAGNDLVNFIGVPLAGYESFVQFTNTPGADPDTFLMTGLTGKVKTPFIFLLFAGLIMVVTLYFNKKAKKVIKTSVDLSRQDEGNERFGSTIFSKILVRSVVNMNKQVSSVLPYNAKKFLNRQFDSTRAEELIIDGERPAFDMIRASINLVVASIIISFATSLTLPLSTTYVTFMVAMGTSLADNAWGRESAVYRITGVISVILGWFVTAMAAFTVAFIIAFLSKIGGLAVIVIFILLALYSVIRSHVKGKKVQESEHIIQMAYDEKDVLNVKDVYNHCTASSNEALNLISDIYSNLVEALTLERRKDLIHLLAKTKTFNAKVKLAKDNISRVIEKLDEESFNAAQYYTLVLDYHREIGHNMLFLVQPSFEHVDNNHKPIGEYQSEHLKDINEEIEKLTSLSIQIIMESKFEMLDELQEIKQSILEKMDAYIMDQIKRLKKTKSGTKNTKLFLDLLAETKTLTFNMVNLVKSQRDLAHLADVIRD